MMTGYQFRGLLKLHGWIAPAYVQLDDLGTIVSVREQANAGINYEVVDGYALPGLQNSHSHAFQYAMAGLNERHPSQHHDNFWGWRKRMYQLALTLDPEQMESIATMLYAELVRHGYTGVAEFHYLHHDKNGNPYADPSEMGHHLIAAAKKAGINITLLPVFYQNGGFGKPPGMDQRRFICHDLHQYLNLLEASTKVCNTYNNASPGCAIHSMRAVEPWLIPDLVQQINSDMPIHMHIAEQIQEVKDAIGYLGKRPVEWLADNVSLDDRWNMIHATHLTDDETKIMARSGAQVVLCPSTEGNLGDGLFPFPVFQKYGGNWCIGTDSHIGLHPFSEIQILDYGQRLITHRRNIFQSSNEEDSGLIALKQIIRTGKKALGDNNEGVFCIGQKLDALVINAQTPLIAATSLPNLTSTIVYASDVSMHLGTLVNGKWIVKNGLHNFTEVITRKFYQTMQTLGYR